MSQQEPQPPADSQGNFWERGTEIVTPSGEEFKVDRGRFYRLTELQRSGTNLARAQEVLFLARDGSASLSGDSLRALDKAVSIFLKEWALPPRLRDIPRVGAATSRASETESDSGGTSRTRENFLQDRKNRQEKSRQRARRVSSGGGR